MAPRYSRPYDVIMGNGIAADGHGPVGAGWLIKPVSASWLVGLLAGWMAFGQLLLWRFLDFAPWPAYLVGIALAGTVGWGIARLSAGMLIDPSRGAMLASLAIALALLILGGEGRFMYANADWQVRFAVLRDMAVNPWPFVYTARAAPDLLRAPIGMFLAPALAFKAGGARAGDLMLLGQNVAMLAVLLSLASTLMIGARARLTTLLVFMLFSGMDALGDLLVHGRLSDHLDDWANIQYSSTITLAFWVPQHALAGWIGALGFMLWREDRLRIGSFLALLPLTALWSPLGLMGAMPFAALAGVQALLARQLRMADVTLPAFACLLCVPTFVYLGAANDGVGIRLLHIPLSQWLTFQALETLPFFIALFCAANGVRFGWPVLWVIALWLLAIPFVQIGWSVDFMMRASIPALAVLSVMTSQHLLNRDRGTVALIAVLMIGGITGLAEVRRALVNDPAPEVRCSFFKAWNQSFADFPKGSYLAPLAETPRIIRPQAPFRVSAVEPDLCWTGTWKSPLRLPTDESGGNNRIER